MTDNKELVLNSNEPLTSQKPKKVVHIEMFKAGPQISSTGQKMMFTEKDLDQVVGTYSPEQHEAPLIIGHDQTDSTPALGWVKDLWRKGKKLWGKVELTPKAEQLIKDGVFKKVSSSFYLPEAETNPHPGKLALRHLGLVSIPAVKGLSAFSEGEANDEKIIDLVPQSGKTVISFKEALETNNSTMTKKKISDEVKEVSVDQNVDHAEGSMTVNINIGGGKPTVYDDSGNEVSETGAPADYQMEYADDEEEKEEMAPEASGEEESDDMGLEEEGGEEAPEASGDMEMPEKEEEGGEEPAGEEGEEDISGEMEDNDKKIASLAAEYEEDELFQALALKKQATSMMENDMSYAEAEGEKKEEEKKEEADHAEEVVDNAEDKMEEKEEEEKKEEEADHSEEVVDNAEEHKEEEKEEEEEEKSDMAEEVKEEKKETADHAEEAAPLATESLDHSEAAIGDQSIDSLNARVAELEEELNKQRKLAREKEISSFAEGLYESGKLTEQVVPKGDLVRFMETLNHKNSVNFSETGKASQFDFMRGVLESLPSMVSFEEFATPASAPKQSKSVEPNASGYAYDPNTADVHADALSYAEENGCDYLTAVKFVINNN
jgi:chemotaxis protein histidine kinase CheA